MVLTGRPTTVPGAFDNVMIDAFGDINVQITGTEEVALLYSNESFTLAGDLTVNTFASFDRSHDDIGSA